MTDPKNETVWITIPDEASAALEAPVVVSEKASTKKVGNRVFWGGGFVVMVAFLIMLVVPQQFADLLQGDLFDGGFQVVPDYEEQEGGALFGDEEVEGTEGGQGAETATAPADENVVEAESEAVSIQVEPVTDAEAGTETATGTEGIDGTVDNEESVSGSEGEVMTDGGESTEGTMMEAAPEAESIQVDLETGDVTLPQGETLTTAEESTSDSDLLQMLSKQLNEMKEKEKQNDQLIQDLMQMLEDQAAGVHGATTNTTGSAYLPTGIQSPPGIETTAQMGTGSVAAGGTFGTQSVYRYNTHTVTVSPYDILAQNKAATTLPANYQANLVYTAQQQVYSQQTYNPALAQVQGQPGTGPAEAILFAFALASLGVLVWGSMRAMRA